MSRKPTAYHVGDRIVLHFVDGGWLDRLNGLAGVIASQVPSRHKTLDGHLCRTYIMTMDDGQQVSTCGCHIRYEPPKITKEWSMCIDWSQCYWRPHFDSLDKPVMQKIFALMEIKRNRKTKK